jgi:hypothetical protein
METELVCHLCGTHSVGQILFVGKDKKDGVAQLVLVEHTMQFITGCEGERGCEGDKESIERRGEGRDRPASIRSRSLESTTKIRPWVFW